MFRASDLLTTALAPVVWGSTYIVTTELLPPGHPVFVSAARVLPAGLLLLLLVRQLPRGEWIWRSFVLGALNFAIFMVLLFIAAYRLPGGIAATVGAVQPLIVIFVAAVVLGSAIRPLAVLAALAGLCGVALLVLRNEAALDAVGIAAALGGAVSMALGTVLTRRWQPPVSPLVFAAWQLLAGGVLLVAMAAVLEPLPPAPSARNMVGFLYMSLSSALTYVLWFRGISRLEPSAVASLGFLSPTTAVLLGWGLLGQALAPAQIAGVALVLAGVWAAQVAVRRGAVPAAPQP
ncbi:EamA family transporter [Stappia sp. 28M-7]|uniref:EamA family transporter n=1 Tax=Stappia sp. 28M-7 TaxID=2762596 RepID=UPI00163C0CAA|nr:EamA family transporter [Stappia sp. 28M-7]MBC2859957.1 EamA family transporter [Stappia sp. 28M-7]